ncbi:MAG: ATP-dependent DNA ligase, partial [Candidatus Eremiobacteraeota bacterium]|nr:ATP-dependent DNA ligase [Candidatus Eremiobacteraeota bacterium]
MKTATKNRLAEYERKRDFSATPEPSGAKRKRASTKKLSFVVQEHRATRLHWDFRLEAAGTMPSWAVTRGPTLVPLEKRLAMHVEDHPLDYQTFEGVIP